MQDDTHVIYAELDVLIDTRATLLRWLDPELFKQSLISGRYQKRFKDQFYYLGSNLFKELYRRRDKEVLQSPKYTYIVEFLNQLSFTYREDSVLQGGSGDVEIIINVYPYVLSEEELETLEKKFMERFKSIRKVITCNIENVTPKWLKEKDVITLSMYNGIKWVNKNLTRGLLRKDPISEMLLLTPKLIDGGKVGVQTEEILAEFELMSNPYINLQFVEVNYFNITTD